MSVILIRHGKPDVDFKKWLSPKEFGEWIESYNHAFLEEVELLTETLECVRGANYIVCSNLSRSLESATKLGFSEPNEIQNELREMELPHLDLPFPKLPVNFWLVFFRITWFLGFRGRVESFVQAKARANHSSKHLIGLSKSHGRVLFVGHGFMNKYIEKCLLKDGHKIIKEVGKGYWGCKIYSPI